MSRIEAAFRQAGEQGRAAFVPYITAGDPSPERTASLVLALERAGADVVELGVPFSDPLADGPVNQRAAQRALAAGTTLEGVLGLVAAMRKDTRVPLVLFTYFNPLHRMGLDRFAAAAAAAGVDGVLVTDLAVDEAADYLAPMRR
ncbi:MAG: tryptophan synthase subunit alpha, partial [Planctomycetota bacterium]